jgi:hypothetical protein
MTNDVFLPCPADLAIDAVRTHCMMADFESQVLHMVASNEFDNAIILAIPHGMTAAASLAHH